MAQIPERGWVLYDGDCSWCTGLVRRRELLLASRGFAVETLQAPWVASRLGLSPERLLEELRVLTVEGRNYGGADAFVFLARSFWWAWPLVAFSKVPGFMPVMRYVYRRVAERRSCSAAACLRK